MKLEKLHVKNFRGIKDLRLDLRGQNFVVAGPNGSGKSGIVDAIEFVFTGRIARLEGAGTGGLSVKEHGPHVDDRTTPGDSWVEITVILDDGREVTIARQVDKPSKPRVTPTDAADAVSWVEDHPEISLSRREIIKFILAEPGQRSKELQAVLKLDRLETARKMLGRSANEFVKAGKVGEQAVGSAKENLLTALAVIDFTPALVLPVVNRRRRALGLPDLMELTDATEMSHGLGEPIAYGTAGGVVDKELATRDLAALEEVLRVHEVPNLAVREVLSKIDELESRPTLLELAGHHELIEKGLAVASSDACPLCDHEWGPGALRAHLSQKLEMASVAHALITQVREGAMVIRQDVQRVVDRLETVARHAAAMAAVICAEALREWRDELIVFCDALTTTSGILGEQRRLAGGWARPSDRVVSAFGVLRESVEQLAPPSLVEEARKFLLVANERLAVYREKQAERRRLASRSAAASRVKQHFDDTIEARLSGLYSAIENDLVRFYKLLNEGDEDGFSAKLTAESGTVALEVAFYGRGQFPPGAYHSEGHQDGMGLCLYLALMRQLFGGRFTFGVLDDVVMSVDKGHRRRVCELLRTEFSGTQFIITTHDDVWLHQMIGSQLVTKRGVKRFRGWSVERGPLVDDYRDVWQALDEHLAKDETATAAGLLRRHLEHVAGDLCERLRASVAYRRDVDHDLGELLPSAVSRWAKLLAKAKDSANSWGMRDQVDAIVARDTLFKERHAVTQMEQWALNKCVHYNEWENLTSGELRNVAAAYREFLDVLRCERCDAWFGVMPAKGAEQMLTCDCKATCLNLHRKPPN